MANLPRRKSIRLQNYDYSTDGFYYLTICTQNRKCLFGDIVNGEMKLNDIGKIVKNIWKSLPNHHHVELDIFQIMPNHVHFVIQIVGATRGSPVTRGLFVTRPTQTGRPRPKTGRSRPTPTAGLGTIVGLFKSECTKQINIVVGATRGSPVNRGSPKIHVWQRNYYEHIIRAETDLNKIRQYIQNNPQMWERDRNNPKNFMVLLPGPG